MTSYSASPRKNFTLLVKPKDQPKFMTILQATSSLKAHQRAKEMWPDASIIVTESSPVSHNKVRTSQEEITRWRKDYRHNRY